VIEAAAAAHRSSSASRPTVDFHSPESKTAMRTLRLLFLPVVLRSVLLRRRRAHWKHGEPPRRYTSDSVVSAIASSKTMLAEWPLRVLEQLAGEATFHFLGPKEFIVYSHEPHVSCGIVVLLHGQLEERRPDPTSKQKGASSSGASTRPIRTQTRRLHKATDVLCVMPVLCEDRTTSSFATREKEEADVAVISSRWFWEVYYGVAQSSLPASEVLTRYMKDVVAPHRRDIVMADYFPTSVVLLRSWMWPLLTASDRVKLCRAMEVRVLGVGEVLCDEGEYCPYIYFVRRGALTVVVKGEALAVLEAGACFGEESVLFHEKRNSSVVGATMCELYALHVRHLEHRLTKYPELGRRLITAAVERQTRWMEEGKTRDVFGLISILSGVPCLGHSTDTMREELARCATVRSLPQGQVLATANTPCTALFVIGRGSVVLSSVVKSSSMSNVGEGARRGSSAGRNTSLPPKHRASSAAKGGSGGNPRAASIVDASPLNLREVTGQPPEVRREVRSTGDFFGELCLKPHLWPCDVTCETTVNVWQFDREAILRVLEQNRADAQAIEVCRQGISLYRGQRGEASLIEGFEAPNTTPVTANGRRPSAVPNGGGSGSFTGAAVRRGSRVPSSQAPGRRRASSTAGTQVPRVSVSQLGKLEDSGLLPPALPPDVSTRGRSPRSSAALAEVEWTPEQWTEYAMTRLQEGLTQEAKDAAKTQAAVPPPRELRPVDKEVEKAMKEKVLQLIAVQPSISPNPADCDISGEGDELQAIIVEQLFLIPTEGQPRFIRQVNDSNVRLITEDEEPTAVLPDLVPLEADELRDPWQSGEAPISVGGVMRLEDVDAAESVAEDGGPRLGGVFAYSFQGATTDMVESGTMIRSIGENLEWSGQVALPPALGRSRRSISMAALEDSGVGFMNSFAGRNSISRSHFVRPPSGMPLSPRASNVARTELISPRGMSAVRPGSSSEPRAAPPTRTRPASVDYNQFNKVGVDRSTSVLDRYVKIEDQNYFDDYVKVLPLQQDEIWAPDEVVVEDEISPGSLVLLLLHVRCCDYLAAEVMQRCQRPIVKVTLGQRVLVRTSVMHDLAAPRWPIEASSFITFVRRGTEVVFAVCDADDESNVVYRCTLQTAAIRENGGVGQQVMTLKTVPRGNSGDSDANAEEENRTASLETGSESLKTPRMTTMMLAVTATKYKALRQALKKDKEKEQLTTSPVTTDTMTSTLFLQVMSVEGLKHRIEASVTVSLYNGGTLRQLLETSQALPKTRSPAWPGDKAFVKVCGEGGVLTFNLQHKGAVIGSVETTVDELVFGGVGLRRLPLLQAQTGSSVMGQLVVCVIGANGGGVTESRSHAWVTHVAVEELHLSPDGFAITPDPFVVLRDGAGTVQLRTPLVCGDFTAAWTMAEASCLLPCPRLSGSTATYHLEVCDSDEMNVVGRASVTVAERGLADGTQRRDIALDPPGSGSVRVRSLCLPVHELPEKRCALLGAASSPGRPAALPNTLPADATVLLVYVSGCTDLPGGATEEFQTDAVATLTIDDCRRYLRAPIREGTTSPRWSLAKASVLLHVPSGDPSDAHGNDSDHECRFGVYDGVVDEVNLIGQVAVPLAQLLSTAEHTFPLFTKANGSLEKKKSSVFDLPSMVVLPTSVDAAAAHERPAERTVGKVHVSTLLGRLGGQVDAAGVEDAHPGAHMLDTMENKISGGALPSATPYYNPDGAALFFSAQGTPTAPRASLASVSGSSGTVLLSVSNVCNVLPNASAKYIHLVVRQGPTPVLSVECQMGVSSHAEWGLTDSSAALSRAVLLEEDDSTLSVELHAMDVVEGKGEGAKDPAKAVTTVAATSSLSSMPHELRQQTSVPTERVLIGNAELPTAKLAAVGVGEVDVVTLRLEGGRPLSPAPSSRAARASAEGVATVSFCIIGNRC
jgi:CRP-like cAMP-binding protein